MRQHSDDEFVALPPPPKRARLILNQTFPSQYTMIGEEEAVDEEREVNDLPLEDFDEEGDEMDLDEYSSDVDENDDAIHDEEDDGDGDGDGDVYAVEKRGRWNERPVPIVNQTLPPSQPISNGRGGGKRREKIQGKARDDEEEEDEGDDLAGLIEEGQMSIEKLRRLYGRE